MQVIMHAIIMRAGVSNVCALQSPACGKGVVCLDGKIKGMPQSANQRSRHWASLQRSAPTMRQSQSTHWHHARQCSEMQ